MYTASRDWGACLIVALSTAASGCQPTGGQAVEEPGRQEHPAETAATEAGRAMTAGAAEAVHVAVLKAEELEYDLSAMLLELEQTPEGGFKVQFNPRDKQQRGGNLTVHVDAEGTIAQVQRWR